MVHVFHPLVPLHDTGSHEVFEHVLQSPSMTFVHAIFYYLALILQLIVLIFSSCLYTVNFLWSFFHFYNSYCYYEHLKILSEKVRMLVLLFNVWFWLISFVWYYGVLGRGTWFLTKWRYSNISYTICHICMLASNILWDNILLGFFHIVRFWYILPALRTSSWFERSDSGI